MAVAAGILADIVISIKVIATGRIIRIIVHNRILASNHCSHGMSALNPSRLIMAKKTNDLLSRMFGSVLEPIRP
jgi:hypothetical protein